MTTASTIDVEILKKIHASGMTTLIISNEEMNDMNGMMYLILYLKSVTKTIENETKEQKGGGFGEYD